MTADGATAPGPLPGRPPVTALVGRTLPGVAVTTAATPDDLAAR